MPSRTCIVCGNNRRLASYFQFPVDNKRKLEWCQLLSIDIRNVSKSMTICDQHFHSKQFVNKRHLHLRKNALPVPVSSWNVNQVTSQNEARHSRTVRIARLPSPGISSLTSGPGVQIGIDKGTIVLQQNLSNNPSTITDECVNCCAPVNGGRKVVGLNLSTMGGTDHVRKITPISALNFIYKVSGKEMPISLPNSDPSPESQLGLCFTCWNVVLQLFLLHEKLTSLTNLNSIVNKTFKVLDEMSNNTVIHQKTGVPDGDVLQLVNTSSNIPNKSTVTEDEHVPNPGEEEISDFKLEKPESIKLEVTEGPEEIFGDDPYPFNDPLASPEPEGSNLETEHLMQEIIVKDEPMSMESNEKNETTDQGSENVDIDADSPYEPPRPIHNSSSTLTVTTAQKIQAKIHLPLSSSKLFRCPEPDCTYSARLRVSLRKHKELKHVYPEFKIHCPRCSQEFLHEGPFMDHQGFCCDPAERPHLCDACGKRYKTKEYLDLHYSEFHKMVKDEKGEWGYPRPPLRRSYAGPGASTRTRAVKVKKEPIE